jgi:hypothetical protein
MVSVVASETKKWAFLGQTACHLNSYKTNIRHGYKQKNNLPAGKGGKVCRGAFMWPFRDKCNGSFYISLF